MSDAGKPETEVRELYRVLLDAWNEASAEGFAAPFAVDGEIVGFDGSQIAGRAAIAAELGRIFADHATGTHVGKVRSVRALGSGVALLRAVAGMVPAGRSELDPALNMVQTLVAERRADGWCVVLFQHTPARLRGRPALTDELTEELRREPLPRA